MDFLLSEEQKMLRTMARDFADRELEPIAARIDEEAVFPAESFQKMARLGLLGVGLPKKYGGGDGGAIESGIVVEEISRVCAGMGTILLVSQGLVGHLLDVYCNEEQKKTFLTTVATGEKLAAFALTEPGVGSDPADIETTATPHQNGYLLNGSKTFITNGAEAEISVIFASVDKSLRHKGIAAFIVERGASGFSVGKLVHKLGIRCSSTTELILKDCFVPEENRVGKDGEGFKIAMNSIDASRVAIAAQAVGIAQGAFDKSVAYARQRQQFGKPIASFEAIQWMLADMATQIDAARLLTYRAANLQDKGFPFVKEASMAKLFASEAAASVTTKAIQIHGGYGYTTEYPLERYFRDARITEIYEGTSEMQRLTIARHILRDN